MSDIPKHNDDTFYTCRRLDKVTAEKFADQIVKIWDLIPNSKHTIDDVLMENKHDRPMFAKWKHSLILLSNKNNDVIGFLIGYERKSESNDLYPQNTLYLNSLSIDTAYQGKGLGGLLVNNFISQLKEQKSFFELDGPPTSITVQTNSEEWNQNVIDFYQKQGFEIVGYKQYPNKKDVVMRYYL